MNELCFAGIAFVIALIVGRLLIPSIILVSMKRRLFDQPNSRKLHSRQISRLGGISFLPASTIAFCVALFLMNYFYPVEILSILQTKMPDICLFIIGFVTIFIVGIVDDLSGVSYRYKFVLQAIAALVIVAPLLYVKSADGILGVYDLPAYVSIPLTSIVVVLIINAYNLIDGVDGLCSGLSIVTISTLGLALISVGEVLIFILSAGIVGVLSVFFFYNVFGKRMKIFMGDTGSLTLGFLVAYLSFQYIETSYGLGVNALPFATVIGCVFVPVFDATRLFVFRMIKGNSPFMPDRNHIHHKFIAIGFSHIQTTFSVITLQLIYILLNTLLAKCVNINVIIFIDICIALGVNSGLNLLIARRVKVGI